MTTPTALDSFLDKWRGRWPEWPVAEVFLATPGRDRMVAWFALLQEFDDILNVAGDPLPADAKLGWWAAELRDWDAHRSRHPLGRLLEPVAAPWARLADALPTLIEARGQADGGDAALASVSGYAEAVCDVETELLGGARPAPVALAAQVLAARLAQAGPLAVPRALEVAPVRNAASPDQAQRDWARELLLRWPATSAAARARRIYASFARQRLQRLADGGPSLPVRQPLGDLWRAWRAASGGP